MLEIIQAFMRRHCPNTVAIIESGVADWDDYIPSAFWKVAGFATYEESRRWREYFSVMTDEVLLNNPPFEVGLEHKVPLVI